MRISPYGLRRVPKKAAVPTGEPQRRRLRIAEAYPPARPDLAALLASPATLATVESGYRDASGLAQDAGIAGPFDTYCSAFDGLVGSHGFIGYPLCSELAQYGLMQAGVQTLADEMTRKFPEFSGPSEDASADAAKAMNDEMDRLNVRAHFHRMAEYCGYFGGGLLFIDLGRNDPGELAKPISLTPEFIAPGSVKRLVPVEPISVGPLSYNSTDPLKPDYFQPGQWFVVGRGPVHSSRFLRFVKNEPPLLLRPAYNFLGIPDVQMALDYMVHFTETRESAARLLKKFSLTIVKTNVDALLYGSDDSDVRRRIAHLARERDNDGVYAISYEDEDVVQLNTPLSGVTDIVRQALEMLACIWRIPVIKFLGISPSGMNATGESDIRSFYDHVGSQVQKIFGHPLAQLSTLMQLNLLGEVRDDVRYTWPSLWEMTEREKAEVNKIKADTDAIYLDRYTVDQEEARSALSTDENSRYAGIVPEEVPEPPMQEQDADGVFPSEIRDYDRAGEVPE